MLGELLAGNLKKKPGDTLEIQGSPFTVVAVYNGGSALEAGAVILPLDQLQQLSSLQGKVPAIHVRLRPAPAGEAPEQYLKRAQAQIEAALPGLRAVPAAERASNNQIVLLAHAVCLGHILDRVADRHPGHRQHHGHVGLRTYARDRHPARAWLEALACAAAHPD